MCMPFVAVQSSLTVSASSRRFGIYERPLDINTLYNVCSVPLGDFMMFSTVGDIMSTVRVLSTVGGYHDACGKYHEYRGVVQYREGT